MKEKTPQNTEKSWEGTFDNYWAPAIEQAFTFLYQRHLIRSTPIDDARKVARELKSFITRIRQEERERVRKIVEGMKKPLWNDDIKKHTTNIVRHNLIDEILKRLSENEAENGCISK